MERRMQRQYYRLAMTAYISTARCKSLEHFIGIFFPFLCFHLLVRVWPLNPWSRHRRKSHATYCWRKKRWWWLSLSIPQREGGSIWPFFLAQISRSSNNLLMTTSDTLSCSSSYNAMEAASMFDSWGMLRSFGWWGFGSCGVIVGQ